MNPMWLLEGDSQVVFLRLVAVGVTCGGILLGAAILLF